MGVEARRATVGSVVALAVLSALASTAAFAAEEPARPRYAEVVEAKPGPIRGHVLYPEGLIPAAKVPVRAWRIGDKEFVAEVMTDDKGAYALPSLAEGRYRVVFGDRVTVSLIVSKKAERPVKTLDVIVPRGQVIFAQMAQERRAAVLALLGAEEAAKEASEAAAEAGAEQGVEATPAEPGEDRASLIKTIIIGAGGVATAVGCIAIIDNARDSHHDDDDKCVCSP